MKTQMILAAATVLGTAYAAVAEPAGVPETRFPAEAISQVAPAYEGRKLVMFESLYAAMPRSAKSFTAEEKALFERANGNIHN
jgi:hypothetical protein